MTPSMTDRVSGRALCAGLVTLALLTGAARAEQAGAAGRPTAVVELFTSQGCANCPPADRLLSRLADEPGIIALTLPIDYWNYLGWSDTRATPQNSARQMAYAAARRDREVFTPQVVVNGRLGLVGTDESEIRREAMLQAEAGEGPRIPVAMSRVGGVLEVRVGAAPGDAPPETATVWVAAVEPKVSVYVDRGENAGREVVYRNVVRGMQAVGVWRGQPISIDLPLSAYEETGTHCLVVLVQAGREDGPGPILGAGFLHVGDHAEGRDVPSRETSRPAPG